MQAFRSTAETELSRRRFLMEGLLAPGASFVAFRELVRSSLIARGTSPAARGCHARSPVTGANPAPCLSEMAPKRAQGIITDRCGLLGPATAAALGPGSSLGAVVASVYLTCSRQACLGVWPDRLPISGPTREVATRVG
jgi:hypothetical protein